MSELPDHYSVLYCKKSDKKRKTYLDGFMKVTKKHIPSGTSFLVLLIDDDGKDVVRKTINDGSGIEVGETFILGYWEIQIESCIDASSIEKTQGSNQEDATSLSLRQPSKVSARPQLKVAHKFAIPSRTQQSNAPQSLQKMNVNVHSKSAPSSSSATSSSIGQKRLQVSVHNAAQSFAQKRDHCGGPPAIDAGLARLMKPHQITAADFLIEKLYGRKQSPTLEGLQLPRGNDKHSCGRDMSGNKFLALEDESEDSEGYADNDDDSDLWEQIAAIDSKSQHNHSQTSNSEDPEKMYYGAILADEMGLGKTLTSIAVMWTYIKKYKCRGVVVCPSSVIDNWSKEIKRWLGCSVQSLLCVKPGPDADAMIKTFKCGSMKISPILIISYDMFRRHSGALNTVPNLDIMVCDEGHRLKNSGGTKTISALKECKAKMRLLLTGTPVQNDLEELYSVVSVVAPGFLGSLSQYKSAIVGPIERAQEVNNPNEANLQHAQLATVLLRGLLSQIVIRRTQADILKNLLPPRRDFEVRVKLVRAQQVDYDEVVAETLHELGINSQVADSSIARPFWDDEAEEDNSGLDSSAGSVLAVLQKLRMLCNISENSRATSMAFKVPRTLTTDTSGPSCNGDGYEKENVNVHASAQAKDVAPQTNQQMGLGSGLGLVGNRSTFRGMQSTAGAVLSRSSKLQVLDGFLSSLWSSSSKEPSREKVVVVSNFTSMLDHVASLARERHWEYLRLDGSVPVSKRQPLVDCFNRVSDARNLFLLSSKAGGVGLNLIGGSRLVMLDCDWNPAIDKQAMARIWRQGQTKSCFIYRFIADRCIEDAIMQRQENKSALAAVIEDPYDSVTLTQSQGEAQEAPSDDEFPADSPTLSSANVQARDSENRMDIYANVDDDITCGVSHVEDSIGEVSCDALVNPGKKRKQAGGDAVMPMTKRDVQRLICPRPVDSNTRDEKLESVEPILHRVRQSDLGKLIASITETF